jgi:hypothetical protein
MPDLLTSKSAEAYEYLASLQELAVTTKTTISACALNKFQGQLQSCDTPLALIFSKSKKL